MAEKEKAWSCLKKIFILSRWNEKKYGNKKCFYKHW
jgi:hypothetical protein